MKTKTMALLIQAAFILLVGGVVAILTAGRSNSGILINEVCSWNWSLIVDEEENYSDYIELYNSSDRAVSLAGWYLSDDENQLKKSMIGDVTIEAGGYAVLYANGRGNASDALSFKLSRDGEKIFLTDPNGKLTDSVVVPELSADTAYARLQDGGADWEQLEVSPGETNNDCLAIQEAVVTEPVFSEPGGFYEEPFVLEVRTAPGTIVYYTTDGSIPDKNSGIYIEEKGIQIEAVSGNPDIYNVVPNVVREWKEYPPSQTVSDKAMVVRAVAADEQGNVSETATASYFVGMDAYKEQDVLMLTADPEDLFGEDGIYVTGRNYDTWYLGGQEGEEPDPNFIKGGRQWEIEGNVELFTQGEGVLNQTVGLRVQGAGSREWFKKRFSIYAREMYEGSSYFDYDIMRRDSKAHSIVFREGFADAFLPELLRDRNLTLQPARQAVVFLNGEYWYSVWLREKYSKYFLQEQYGVNAENVVIISGNDGDGVVVSDGEKEYIALYDELLQFVEEHDLSLDSAYEEVTRRMDIQSYIDFMCATVYLCNMDMSDEKNYMVWRTVENDGTAYGDGTWRWMLYDMDCIEWASLEFHGVSNRAEIDSFSDDMQYNLPPINTQMMFRALKANDSFRQQFVLTFLDMANVNFAPEYVGEKLEAWGQDLSWNDGFFEKRFDPIVIDLAEEFELEGELEEITLEVSDPEAGSIRLNTTMPDLSSGSWQGRYYTDYPITVTAVPNEGYQFVGWEGSDSATGTEETLIAGVRPGLILKAIFKREK